MKVYLTKKNCGKFIVITSKYNEDIKIGNINAKSLYSVMSLELPNEYEVTILTNDTSKSEAFYKEIEVFNKENKQ